jgi:hypothetical protein
MAKFSSKLKDLSDRCAAGSCQTDIGRMLNYLQTEFRIYDNSRLYDYMANNLQVMDLDRVCQSQVEMVTWKAWNKYYADQVCFLNSAGAKQWTNGPVEPLLIENAKLHQEIRNWMAIVLKVYETQTKLHLENSAALFHQMSIDIMLKLNEVYEKVRSH